MGDVIEVKFGSKKMRAAQYLRDIEKTQQQPYEQKFASFSKMCEEGASGKFEVLVIAFPQVLGDNYQEMVSNLSHASEAGLLIAIARGSSGGS